MSEDLKRELLTIKTHSGKWALSSLGVNDPESMEALLLFIRQKQKAEVQRFAGLYGIGGDGNEHVKTYRQVYSNRMNELEDAEERETLHRIES